MDKRHLDKKRNLRIVGTILTIVGGLFSAIGFIDFFSAFGGHGMPTMFWCAFLGLPLLAFGVSLLRMSYLRETGQYLKDETVPVVKDLYRDMKPEFKDFVDTLKGNDNNEEVICSRCGTRNESDNKFCKHCGNELEIMYCPNCGSKLDKDSNYCGNCGHKIN